MAVFDETSFGKLLVVGRDAEAVLQRLCTADVAVEPGRAVYTGMLNERAGYEADVTVTRLAPDRYLLVTSAASPVRDAAWIERHLRAGEHVSVVDVSSAYAVLGVMGPASRQLLGRLGPADLSDDAFPFSTSQEIALGYATVRATRITYVGELGWELYVPTEFAVGVYEDLWRREPISASSTPATPPSTASASTRATGPSAPTSPRTTPRSRRACASPASWRRRSTSSDGRRSRRPSPSDHGGGSSHSASAIPTPCCGVASWCSTTVRRRAR